MTSRSVVFPEPVWPMTPVTPGPSESDTSSSAAIPPPDAPS